MSVSVANRFRCHCDKCVDMHTHFLQRDAFDASQSHSVATCFGKNPVPGDLGWVHKMFDPALQLEDMDARGIDMNVLTSADAVQSRSWASPDEEARLSALVNDECLRWVERHPDRFAGTISPPLGDMAMCLAELERCRPMGFRVIQLPANYRGFYLGHERYGDLWSYIAENRLVVFIHPDGVRDMWFQDYAMWNSIGQSIEEVRVMTSLMYEGVLDRFPGLRIVMAHGGGYMPHYMGRLDRNVTDKPFTAKNLTKMPSEYLRDFYYDSCTYDARTLELLIERVGLDRVVMGGDYPAAMFDPIDFVDEIRASDEDKAKIAGATALGLLEPA
ncbi:amidohydrolase family protein [Rhizorhabdus dicambivorans]|uniref:Amidohydrolase n=1 Tax=Rhizorhabdus dicambivorans TaxID=1850238 RepID=A0A2A4FTW1_9SPHN|nr:amidohydrolase family protein [Rhizorhabdus dicambivorans]ATE65500.1 amidohydrolase [Rhizorhabdus dicambivorans]PCE41843.1 amidohydrolase [Rhizorhabdus dicambivorans]